jgi:hypothetical protein
MHSHLLNVSPGVGEGELEFWFTSNNDEYDEYGMGRK